MNNSLNIRLGNLILGLFFSFALVGQSEQDAAEMKILDGCREAKQLITYYQFEKALNLLGACEEWMPNDENVLSDVALCHFKLGRNVKAKAVYNRIVSINPENLNALVQLAMIYTTEQRTEQALETYQRLLKLDENNSYYHTKIANLYFTLKRYDLAVQHYETSLELNPDDLDTGASLANLYIRIEKYDLAELRLNKSLEVDTLNLRLLRTKARLFYLKEEFRKVLEVGENLIAQSDSTDFTLRVLGLAAYHEGEYEQVKQFFIPLLAREKEEHLLHYYLGIAHQKLEEWEASEKAFQNAIATGIASSIDDYYKQLGYVYEKQNNLKPAMEHYKKAHYYSKENLLLYQLARTSEIYYKDKKIALRYYKDFLKQDNSKHPDFQKYAEYKVKELKGQLHMTR